MAACLRVVDLSNLARPTPVLADKIRARRISRARLLLDRYSLKEAGMEERTRKGSAGSPPAAVPRPSRRRTPSLPRPERGRASCAWP